MSVKERIMVIRLADRISKDPKYALRIGVEASCKENGDRKEEAVNPFMAKKAGREK